jgi:hypothetical protein
MLCILFFEFARASEFVFDLSEAKSLKIACICDGFLQLSWQCFSKHPKKEKLLPIFPARTCERITYYSW